MSSFLVCKTQKISRNRRLESLEAEESNWLART